MRMMGLIDFLPIFAQMQSVLRTEKIDVTLAPIIKGFSEIADLRNAIISNIAIGIILRRIPEIASLKLSWDSFPKMIIPILSHKKVKVLRIELSQPSHQTTKISELTILRGNRQELLGEIEVRSAELKMMNSASSVGRAMKKRMYSVEFHPISVFSNPLVANYLIGSRAMVQMEVSMDMAEKRRLQGQLLQYWIRKQIWLVQRKVQIPKIVLRIRTEPILRGYDRKRSSIRLNTTLKTVGRMIAMALFATVRGTIKVIGNNMRSYQMRWREMLFECIPVSVWRTLLLNSVSFYYDMMGATLNCSYYSCYILIVQTMLQQAVLLRNHSSVMAEQIQIFFLLQGNLRFLKLINYSGYIPNDFFIFFLSFLGCPFIFFYFRLSTIIHASSRSFTYYFIFFRQTTSVSPTPNTFFDSYFYQINFFRYCDVVISSVLSIE